MARRKPKLLSDLELWVPEPEIKPKTKSQIVAEMNATRDKPKRIDANHLVPSHIHEIYAQIWRHEEVERQAIEKWQREHSWRSFLGKFIGLK